MTNEQARSKGESGKHGFHAERVSFQTFFFIRVVYLFVDVIVLAPILFLSLISRFSPRAYDVGIGPVPIINSKYHKQALERYGYKSETFVYHTWYFTDEFDVNIGKYCPRAFGPYVSYVYAIFRYKCIYTYFTGGPLGFTTLLARLEPFLLQLAGIKTVVMPFGSDVHVLTRGQNRLMVNGYARDYPGFRHSRKRTANLIDVWTRGADHIISGCDWIDFLYFWDTLMLAHFAIDTDAIALPDFNDISDKPISPLRLIHAPNHRSLKGTEHIVKAVEELKAEGTSIELSIVEGVTNSELIEKIKEADVVVDQLIIGWYAMFALEGMSMGKPVVCHIRPDFRDVYIGAGILQPDELPLVEASVTTIKETLRHLASLSKNELNEIGQRSRDFVEKHHSTEVIGKEFDRINRSIGLR